MLNQGTPVALRQVNGGNASAVLRGCSLLGTIRPGTYLHAEVPGRDRRRVQRSVRAPALIRSRRWARRATAESWVTTMSVRP